MDKKNFVYNNAWFSHRYWNIGLDRTLFLDDDCRAHDVAYRKGHKPLKNDISTEDYSFFGIEMELWKIGESEPAPKFNIVVSPNEWSKAVKASTSSRTLSDLKILQREFWMEMMDYFTEKDTFLSLRTPQPQNWHTFAIGKPHIIISNSINTQKNRLGCEIYLGGAEPKKRFHKLYEDKDEIEREIGEKLDWMELPQGKDCRIIIYTDGDIRDRENWNKCFEWFLEMTESFHKVFSPIVKQL